jgi:hypothetical protein
VGNFCFILILVRPLFTRVGLYFAYGICIFLENVKELNKKYLGKQKKMIGDIESNDTQLSIMLAERPLNKQAGQEANHANICS